MLSLSQRFEQAANYIKAELVVGAPFETGNLALNAIRITFDKGLAHIVIGGEVAPYAIYTNETWSKGTNPNEGWIQRVINECKPMIIKIMQGAISQEELEKELRRQKSEYDAKLQKHLEIIRKREERLKNEGRT